MNRGLCFKVGRGNNINYWEDPWVPNLPNFKPIPKNEDSMQRHGMVQSLMYQNGGWNMEILMELFCEKSVEKIFNIFWANQKEYDCMMWLHNKNGMFSVKLFYWLENWESKTNEGWWKKLWKSKIHERQKKFMWKLANRGLSVKANLVWRGVLGVDDQCLHGCTHVESEAHLSFKC